jgi:seryl-tRNA synthetase
MIEIKKLRENPGFIEVSSKNKGVEIDVNKIIELDNKVRELNSEFEQISAEKNASNSKITTVSPEERTVIIKEMRELGERADKIKATLQPLAEELAQLLRRIPNPALSDVKVSPNEVDNEVIKLVGSKPNFDFTPLDHETIATKLGIIDKERAAKVSGARFTYLKGDGVLLQLALQNLALQTAAEHGFEPIIVPHLVSADSMQSMGYLEHGGHDEIYYLQKDNQYLIGTSEQSIGPMHKDELFKEADLPKRYIGISPCYRREAGSYGKDTKGILRLHQFDKVEMFSFTTSENSDSEHELILSIEESLMQKLGLHYQVIKMVTGDLGLPAARKYDIETWLPAQEAYRETHSCSTTTDYQTRRLNTRVKRENGNTELAHALNGTAFAMGRTIAAILENYQTAEGKVRVPDVLIPSLGKEYLG